MPSLFIPRWRPIFSGSRILLVLALCFSFVSPVYGAETRGQIEGPMPQKGSGGADDSALQSLQERSRYELRMSALLGIPSLFLIIGGSIMASSDPCEPKAGNNCFEDARRRASWTMIVPGLALGLGSLVYLSRGLRHREAARRSQFGGWRVLPSVQMGRQDTLSNRGTPSHSSYSLALLKRF